MSPTTISLPRTVTCRPSRITCALGAAIFFKAASACSAFDSWTTPTIAFSTTITMMATESTHSPSSNETTAAITRMMTR